MANHFCVVCQKPAIQCCSGCNQAYYCDREHQKIDWKRGHKNNCSPYKIISNETLGRHLVATRNIKPGEIIMKKAPVLIAPKIASFPMCLGCHKRLVSEEDFYSCSKCSWPLCSADCETKDAHIGECEVLARADEKAKILNNGCKQAAYCSIGPLRALLLKNTPKYQSIISMQSNLEITKDTPLYIVLKMNIVPFLKDSLKMDVTEDEILTICSIFDVNAFNIRDTDGLINIRGLYPTASLMAHDCHQNTKHSFHGDNHEMLVIATVPIAKGEAITTTYTQSLWGTLSRRIHLKQAKNFDCTCKRCSDPSEFNTWAGSIFCSVCRRLHQEQDCPKLVSEDPLDKNAPWKCQNCDHIIGGNQMIWGNEALRKEIIQLDKTNPESLERFLKTYKDVLHQTNSHNLEVKYALTQMYGNMDGYHLTELTDEQLKRKIDLCNELLEVADILEPGLSKFRGNLLYDLQAALIVQAKREYENHKITKDAAKEVLEDAMVILQESAQILSTEPGMKEVLASRLEKFSELLDFD